MLARSLFLVLLGVSPCAAQLTASGAVTVADRYVWRGITRVNGWVLQSAADLEVRAGGASLTAGIWSNIELSRPGARDLGDVGVDRRGVGEVDIDVAAGTDVGPLGLTAGWVRYTYHGDPVAGGRGAGENTSELFAALAWRESRIAPELTVFRDIGGTRQVYAEAAVTLPVFASPEPRPAAILFIRPVAAWSAGPGRDRGLTHIDLPVMLDLQLAARWLEPAATVRLHAQWGRDAATRVTDAAGGTTRVKIWAEVGVSAALLPDRSRRR